MNTSEKKRAEILNKITATNYFFRTKNNNDNNKVPAKFNVGRKKQHFHVALRLIEQLFIFVLIYDIDFISKCGMNE